MSLNRAVGDAHHCNHHAARVIPIEGAECVMASHIAEVEISFTRLPHIVAQRDSSSGVIGLEHADTHDEA